MSELLFVPGDDRPPRKCKGIALGPGLVPRKGLRLTAPRPGLAWWSSPGDRAAGPGKGISSNPRHRVGLSEPSPDSSLLALIKKRRQKRKRI